MQSDLQYVVPSSHHFSLVDCSGAGTRAHTFGNASCHNKRAILHGRAPEG
jgi:hypothetical protein